jgi:putative restriction endonuclease
LRILDFRLVAENKRVRRVFVGSEHQACLDKSSIKKPQSPIKNHKSMNPLQRALIEKAAQEQGWERLIASTEAVVTLASARHRARVSITQVGASLWNVSVPQGLIAGELARSFQVAGGHESVFAVSSFDDLAKILRRTAELAQSLPNQAELTYATRLKDALAELGPMTTEVERIVKQRIGQDTFRQALMDYWGTACAVTGIEFPAILRASHAKPWADCATDSERLDVYNGFLLTANLDALFDRGLISFDDGGLMIFSPELPSKVRDELGLAEPMQLRWLSEQHREYLRWHREHGLGAYSGNSTADLTDLPGGTLVRPPAK